MVQLEEKTDKSTLVGDFNTLLSGTDRTSKQKIIKAIEDSTLSTNVT